MHNRDFSIVSWIRPSEHKSYWTGSNPEDNVQEDWTGKGMLLSFQDVSGRHIYGLEYDATHHTITYRGGSWEMKAPTEVKVSNRITNSEMEGAIDNFDNDDYVTIKGGNLSIRYYFSDPQITLKVAPEKEVKFPGSNISFTINQSDLKNLRDALAKFNLPEVLFRSRDGKVTVHGVDTENATSNTFWMDFPSGQSTGDFDLTLNTENLRVARNYDYHVKVSEHLLSEWAVVGPTKDLQLKYYIALEPK